MEALEPDLPPLGDRLERLDLFLSMGQHCVGRVGRPKVGLFRNEALEYIQEPPPSW